MARKDKTLIKEIRKRLYVDITVVVITTVIISAVIFLIPIYKRLGELEVNLLMFIMITVSYVMNAVTLSYVRKKL